MKLATGTTLICPKCGADLEGVFQPSRQQGRQETVLQGLFYVMCDCGLCMLCEHYRDGWEYRVMM